jgi:acetolactate decarboxylase
MTSPDVAQIYQSATMEALLSGVYDGALTIRELLNHGDFGLGTFNGLDGELLILDSTCHRLRSDGSATQVSLDERVPFAVVTRFQPQITLDITEPLDRTAVTALVDDAVGSTNSMAAVHVTGRFETIRTRTVTRQERPYRPFTEATHDQREVASTDVTGTLAGFRMPPWMQGISVAGYHAHFLDADRTRGGHALGYRLVRGTVDIGVYTEFHLSLPRTAQFEQANLTDDDADGQIRRTEGA